MIDTCYIPSDLLRPFRNDPISLDASDLLRPFRNDPISLDSSDLLRPFRNDPISLDATSAPFVVAYVLMLKSRWRDKIDFLYLIMGKNIPDYYKWIKMLRTSISSRDYRTSHCSKTWEHRFKKPSIRACRKRNDGNKYCKLHIDSIFLLQYKKRIEIITITLEQCKISTLFEEKRKVLTYKSGWSCCCWYLFIFRRCWRTVIWSLDGPSFIQKF